MNKLKQKRINAGLSQSQLADAAGISVRVIQDYEQGHRELNAAKAISIYKLAEALGCNMDELIEI